MKKYILIFGFVALFTNSIAFAQEVVLDPVVSTKYSVQSVISEPLEYIYTAETLEMRRNALIKKIQFYQAQLDALGNAKLI